MLNMTIQEQRQAVVTEALTWLYTPFEQHQHLKGCGVDCAWFIAETFNNAIGTALEVWNYPSQWFIHKASERTPPLGRIYKTDEWYIEDLISAGFIEIPSEKKGIGDVALTHQFRSFCHSAIILDWPKVIHAESSVKQVIKVNAKTDHYFIARDVKYFSWGGWHGV